MQLGWLDQLYEFLPLLCLGSLQLMKRFVETNTAVEGQCENLKRIDEAIAKEIERERYFYEETTTAVELKAENSQSTDETTMAVERKADKSQSTDETTTAVEHKAETSQSADEINTAVEGKVERS